MYDPTSILAVSTVALAVATFWLAIEAHKGPCRQIGVQTWLVLEARFDSNDMKRPGNGFQHPLRTRFQPRLMPSVSRLDL